MVEFSSPAAARLFLANARSTGQDRLAVAERGYALRYTDPAAMLAWCEAAASNLPPALHASEVGVLLAHLGNAYRVSCKFRKAQTYFRKALAAAPAEPLILEFYAALLKDKRQLKKAEEFLSRAAKLRRASGPSARLVTTLMQSAVVLGESGLPDRAAESILGALEIIGTLPESAERERLARAAFQNLAKCYVDAGRTKDALWLIRLCKDRLMQGGEVFCLKIDWLMADIAGALGEIDNAAGIYREVRRRFAELGHLQEVALSTLDLARVLLKPRPLQAREEALSVSLILDQLGIPSDARERKLLAAVVEKGSEVALVELAAILRSSGLAWRSAGALLPGSL